MAKRKYSKRTRNMQPAPMTITFGLPVRSTAGVAYIDLSQCASLVNRRFYRQGINWAIAGIKLVSTPGITGEVGLSKLPNTWVMSNAWEKSMRSWTRMNNDALVESQSVRPKFLDFKIYADSQHHQLGFSTNLLLAGHTAGEWEPSKVVYSNFGGVTVESKELIAVGASYPGASPVTLLDAVSLIEGYAASRGLPNVVDPNVPSDADDIGPSATPENWLSAMFNDGTGQMEDVVEDMISENNVAPYPFENGPVAGGVGTHTDTQYPGGANNASGLQVHDITKITASSIGSISRLKGGNFPCGLLRFDTTNWNLPPGETQNLLMMIDMVPGTHRGYLCESMTEM